MFKIPHLWVDGVGRHISLSVLHKRKSKGKYVSINYCFKKANNKNDNKLITLPLWSGYVQIYVILFVLKKSEERK